MSSFLPKKRCVKAVAVLFFFLATAFFVFGAVVSEKVIAAEPVSREEAAAALQQIIKEERPGPPPARAEDPLLRQQQIAAEAGVSKPGASAPSPKSATKPKLGTIGTIIVAIVGAITSLIVFIGGIILDVLLKALVAIANFNNFIHVRAVQVGWVVVRDVVNSFFILALIVIAFGTILRKEKYSYKQLLPRFFISAILVNFSRTIAGIYIDLGQVVMLTFVRATQGLTGQGAFLSGVGISNAFTVSAESGQTISTFSAVAALVIGALAMIALIIVVGVFFLVLVFRVVMLWVLVILSPLPYLLAVLPAFQSRMGQWWDKFTQWVVIGPVLAFFLWLAVVIASPAQGPDPSTSAVATELEASIAADDRSAKALNQPSGASAFTKPSDFLSFIVIIALLATGLQFAGELGGMAGGIAAAASQKVARLPISTLRGAARTAGLAYKGAAAGLYGLTGFAGPATRLQRVRERLAAIPTKLEERGQRIELERKQRKGKKAGDEARAAIADTETLKESLKKEREREIEERATNLESMGLSELRQNFRARVTQEHPDLSDDEQAVLANEKWGEYKKLEPAEKGKALHEIAEQEYEKSSGDFYKDNMARLEKKIQENKAKEKDAMRLTPADLARRAALNAEESQASKDYEEDATDGDVMASHVRASLKKKDKKQIAGSLLATARGGTIEDVLEDQGLDRGSKGLQQLANKLVKDAKMSEQHAMDLMRRVSDIAGQKQLKFAGAFKAMPSGEVKAADYLDYQKKQYTKLSKMNPDTVVRAGTADTYMTKDKDGQPQFGAAGLKYVVDEFKQFLKSINTGKMNVDAAAAMSQPQNLQLLKALGEKQYTSGPDKELFGKFFQGLESYGKRVAATQAAGTTNAVTRALKQASQIIGTGGQPTS